ncbi:MAG: response regulator [Candidatus Anammoxibacter sp.]
MSEKRMRHILDMFNYYSDTFARLPLADLKDVGKTAINLISSILSYKVSAILTDEDNKELVLLAGKGIDKDSLPAWDSDKGLIQRLWDGFKSPAVIKSEDLDKNIAGAALQLGLGEVFLVAPLNATIEHEEHQIGLVIAAQPRGDHELEVDLMALETIAGIIAGGVTNSITRARLLESTVSKNYVDNIIRSMVDMLIVHDVEGEIITVNSATTELLGYEEDELIGWPVSKVFGNGEIPFNTCNGFCSNVEKTYLSKDGIMIPVLFSCSAIRGENDKVQGIVCVALDITERKKADEDIKRKNNELQNMNEEIQAQSEELEASNEELCAQNETIVEANRNIEKSYDDLKDAYKKISELEEVKTNFVSTVSHELRTPLTSVLGFATTTLNYYENDIFPLVPMVDKKVKRRANRIKQNLSIVVSEAERLTRLINDVLDIAKMEAGKTEWDIREINIIEVCRQALATVSGYPKSDQVEVQFEAPDNVRAIKSDMDRLVQVIVNFISNALKFTKQGNVTLSVEEREEDVKVMVSDTGKGISKEGLGKVFEKFTQVEDEVEEGKPKGTGLGLPICKGIIENLGGIIWAESEVGRGSRFCFTVNYYAVEKGKPTDSYTRVRKRVIEEVRHKVIIDTNNKRPSILVVDDCPNIRELLRQELESERYNVLEAKNGTEALSIIKNRDIHVDLILLDIMMPDVDGFDVLSAIKTNEKLANIPVIVISAYEYKQKIYRLGAEGFLSKPIDQAQLFSDMSTLLNGFPSKKVLVIDSDDNIIADIKSSLKEKGYFVDSASNAEDGVKKAQSAKPDVIMLNLDVPDIKNGLETLKKLRLDETTGHIHIILIADRMNEDARRIAETLNVEISKAKDVPELLENSK